MHASDPLQRPEVERMESNRSHTPHDINDLGKLEEREFQPTEQTVLDSIVWRKLDTWVLPLCTGMFILSILACVRT